MSRDSLHDAIRKACLPGAWSRGVKLARDGAVLFDRQDPDEPGGSRIIEVLARVRSSERPVHPRVTLWPEDDDAHCDCGDRVEPCAHVAAAVIALKDASAARVPPHVDYRFRRDGTRLRLDRHLVDSQGASAELRGTLVAHVGGLRSGRVTGAEIPASREDFAADAALGPGATLTPERATLLARALARCPWVTLDDARVGLTARSIGWRVHLSPGTDSGSIRARLERDAPVDEVFANLGFALSARALRPLAPVPELLLPRALAASQGAATFSGARLGWLYSEALPELDGRLPVVLEKVRTPEIVRCPPEARLRLEDADSGALAVVARVVYGDPPLAEVAPDGSLELGSEGRVPARDRAAEQALAQRLRLELRLQPGRLTRFEGDEAVSFRARAASWRLEGSGAESFSVRGRLEPRVEWSGDTPAGISFGVAGGGRVDARAVLASWREGRAHVALASGGWAELPRDWLDRYGAVVERAEKTPAPDGRVASLLDALTLAESTSAALPDPVQRIRDRLRGAADPPGTGLPADFLGSGARLRDYQRLGLDWLVFLRGLGAGALLADDMGLGKTLQALLALPQGAPCLVAAPTSVLATWSEQATRFRPALDVALYHGPQRQWPARPGVVLTSHGLVRQEADRFASLEWNTFVLDEAQAIRNPESELRAAAGAIPARHRIALTGTPIENDLSDLWSVLDFLNPGLLGSRAEFDEVVTAPIARGDPRAIAELRSRVRPFTLRRLKEKVAPELPARSETVLRCELSAPERELYSGLLAATRASVLEALDGGTGGLTLGALEALLRLRQACCHPSLVPGSGTPPDAPSSKLALLAESLRSAAAAGHRSLVFSQWTSLLDLVEPLLRESGLAFERLDGSTHDRAGVVARFQSPSGPPVLLLSLKAGGVGLTLTAADHAYLLDPWWNPAAEDQAASRVHRIGQDRPVFIHRLVAEGTVEERVLALQAAKRELAAAALGDEASLARALTRTEWLSLLTEPSEAASPGPR